MLSPQHCRISPLTTEPTPPWPVDNWLRPAAGDGPTRRSTASEHGRGSQERSLHHRRVERHRYEECPMARTAEGVLSLDSGRDSVVSCQCTALTGECTTGATVGFGRPALALTEPPLAVAGPGDEPAPRANESIEGASVARLPVRAVRFPAATTPLCTMHNARHLPRAQRQRRSSHRRRMLTLELGADDDSSRDSRGRSGAVDRSRSVASGGRSSSRDSARGIMSARPTSRERDGNSGRSLRLVAYAMVTRYRRPRRGARQADGGDGRGTS